MDGDSNNRALDETDLRSDSESSSASSPDKTDSCSRHRLRITKVEVLINTNVTGGNAIIDALEHYLQSQLWTAKTLEKIIELDDPKLLLKVEVQAPAIEVGARQRRIHAHFILRIRHAAKVHLGRLQPNIQRHVRQNSMFLNAFVSVRLLNSVADNYALKDSFLCD